MITPIQNPVAAKIGPNRVSDLVVGSLARARQASQVIGDILRADQTPSVLSRDEAMRLADPVAELARGVNNAMMRALVEKNMDASQELDRPQQLSFVAQGGIMQALESLQTQKTVAFGTQSGLFKIMEDASNQLNISIDRLGLTQRVEEVRSTLFPNG